MRLLRLLVLIVLLTPATAAAKTAPGAPGERALWTAADKDGFGTAHSTKSKVWHTLNGGELTEVYYPRLDTPALRDLQFVVSDGKTFAERETDAASHTIALADTRSLTYRQVTTTSALPDRQDLRGRSGAQRAARRRRLHVAHRQAARPLRARRPGALQQRQRRLRRRPPATRCSPRTRARARRSSPRRASRAPPSATWARATAGATCARTSGWTGAYDSAPNGNVVQTGRTALDGVKRTAPHAGARLRRDRRRRPQHAARRARPGLLRTARPATSRLAQLPRLAEGAPGLGALDRHDLRRVGDDARRARGQDVPRRLRRLAVDAVGVGPGLSDPSGAYHLVWSRDLYQIATALLAAGDRAGAARASDLPVRPPAEGRRLLPAELDRRRHAEVGQPAARRGRVPDRARLAARAARRRHLTRTSKAAVGCIARQRPADAAGALGEPGRLLARHDRGGDRRARLRRRPRARQRRHGLRRGLATDRGRLAVEGRRLDRDHQRPLLLAALLPAPDQGRQPERGHDRTTSATPARSRSTSARSSTRASSSSCASASSPRRSRRSATRSRVVDGQLGVDTPERALLAPLQLRRLRREEGRRRTGTSTSRSTRARTGSTTARSAHLADLRGRARRVRAGRGRPRGGARAPAPRSRRPPAPRPHDRPSRCGTTSRPRAPRASRAARRTLSATPLAWSHAQFVRLAWSIDAGRPVEQPSIVARRYGGG